MEELLREYGSPLKLVVDSHIAKLPEYGTIIEETERKERVLSFSADLNAASDKKVREIFKRYTDDDFKRELQLKMLGVSNEYYHMYQGELAAFKSS